MSTTYRAVITCDEQRTPKCLGLLELSGPTIRIVDRAAFVPMEQGWLRGYGVDSVTYDVCPACQSPVTERVMALGRPGVDRLPEEEARGEEEEPGRLEAEPGRRRGRPQTRDGEQDTRDDEQQQPRSGVDHGALSPTR